MSPSRFFRVCALLSIISGCSLPLDPEPAKWQVYMEVPVVEKRIKAQDILHKSIVPGYELNFEKKDSDSPISLQKKDSLHYVVEQDLIHPDSSVIRKKMGAATLKNMPQNFVCIPFTNGNTDFPYGIPLQYALTLNLSSSESLKGIRNITFDESSKPLEITLINKSATNLTDINVSILDGETKLGEIKMSSLKPGQIRTRTILTANKTISNTIRISAGATVPKGSVINDNDSLGVKFSLDGLSVAKATLAEKMIEFSKSFEGTLGLSGPIAINTIDIDNASINCEIESPSRINFKLDCIIDNAWKLDFAKSNNLKSLSQIKKLADSSFFAGDIIHDTLLKSNRSNRYSFAVPLENMRLFPSWSTSSVNNFLKYRMNVSMVSDSCYINFDKNDIWGFKLSTEKLPFVNIDGTLKDSITASFVTEQSVNFGLGKATTDSAKEAFRFQSVKLSMDFIPEIPQKSSLDSLRLDIDMNTNVNPGKVIKTSEMLKKVSANSAYTRNVEINSLINDWPEKIFFNTRLVIPKNTDIAFRNDKNHNTIAVGVNVLWNIQIPFAWQVLDTIVTELQPQTIAFDAIDLDLLNRIENARININFNATNNSNLNIVIHALIASEKHKDELMAFPDSLICHKDIQYFAGENIFCVFGPDGFKIAPRGSKSSSITQLNLDETSLILSKEKCLMRLFLTMPSCGPDQFTNTDFIDLNAVAAIEGIGRTDSLLCWND
ncbi:MAG: hypothetical protein Q4F84_00795 [Fibrobacter sp.]|nr:hypothetical protein [Fibrobacter sp.]